MAKSNIGRVIPTPMSLMGALQDEANRQAKIRPNCPPIYTPARVLSVLGLFPAILAAVESGIDSLIAIHAARVLAVIDGMAVKGFCDYGITWRRITEELLPFIGGSKYAGFDHADLTDLWNWGLDPRTALGGPDYSRNRASALIAWCNGQLTITPSTPSVVDKAAFLAKIMATAKSSS
jgi:hypothetical protein